MRFNIHRWISVFLIGRLLLFLPQSPVTGPSMLSPQSEVQSFHQKENGCLDLIIKLQDLRNQISSGLAAKRTEIEKLLKKLSGAVPQSPYQFLLTRAELAWWAWQARHNSLLDPAFRTLTTRLLNEFIAHTEINFWKTRLTGAPKIQFQWAGSQDFLFRPQVEAFLSSNDTLRRTLFFVQDAQEKGDLAMKKFFQQLAQPLTVKLSLPAINDSQFTLLAEVKADSLTLPSLIIQGNMNENTPADTLLIKLAAPDHFSPVGVWSPSQHLHTEACETGKTFEDYIQSQASNYQKGNLDILRIYVASRIIQSYLNLFTRFGEASLIPKSVTLDNVRIVEVQGELPGADDVKIIFSEKMDFSFLPESKDGTSRYHAIVEFIKGLHKIALTQKVNPKYFLALFLEKATALEKAEILVAIIAGSEKTVVYDAEEEEKSLPHQAYQELIQLLETQFKAFENMPPALPEEVVLRKKRVIDRLLEIIPSSLNSLLEQKIGRYLLALLQAPHPLAKQYASAWLVLRYNLPSPEVARALFQAGSPTDICL